MALAAVLQAELSKMVHVSAIVTPTNSLTPTDSATRVPSTWSPRITNASALPVTGQSASSAKSSVVLTSMSSMTDVPHAP